MLNFVPKTHPSVSLLFGKRPLQRMVCGTHETSVEVPLDVVEHIPKRCDDRVSYVANKYHSMPWEDFVNIKIDAANLIDSNVKSALTDLKWFPQIEKLYAGQQAQTEIRIAEARNAKKLRYPVAQ
eukprot:GEMP01088501.1.p1 GENE.GEMP01088501.1~~GEMP01088501.1.p1  ORF type:complete len:125 (+),score=26.40 GEMP01088501.1:59-433(+)